MRQQRRYTRELFDHELFERELKKGNFGAEGDLLRNYLKRDELWMLKPHALFDPEFYSQHFDAPLNCVPLLDYCSRGDNAPDPRPLFVQKWYLERNSHVKTALGSGGSPA